MSYKRRIIGLEEYNPVSKVPSPRAMQQFRIRETTELSGKTVEFCFDGLQPVIIDFLDENNLQWTYKGEPFKWEKYDAVKADDSVYLFKFMLSGRKPETNISILWDLESSLATCVYAQLGAEKDRPRLVTSKVYFGAERCKDGKVSEKRHMFTKELIGKRVIWRYNQLDEVMHIYAGENYFRLGDSEKILAENSCEREIKHYEYLTGRTKIYPHYEEPAFYIKIKEGMYLYSVTEDNINKLLPENGGAQMLIVLDTKGPRYIGRDFGIGPDNSAMSQFIGAIGKFCSEPDPVEAFSYPMYK